MVKARPPASESRLSVAVPSLSVISSNFGRGIVGSTASSNPSLEQPVKIEITIPSQSRGCKGKAFEYEQKYKRIKYRLIAICLGKEPLLSWNIYKQDVCSPPLRLNGHKEFFRACNALGKSRLHLQVACPWFLTLPSLLQAYFVCLHIEDLKIITKIFVTF